MKKKKPSRAKGIQKEVNETDPRFEFLSEWIALDMHFELRIGMPDAKVTKARIADPSPKGKCSYCGISLQESEHLELEIEYQGVDTELYNTLLLCKEVDPCSSNEFFVDVKKLSRYMSDSLIQHYREKTLNKTLFSPLR